MTIIQAIKKMIDEIIEPCEIMVLDRYLKEALNKLGVSKSKVNPVGEYAEYLAATAFNGTRMSNAKEGHDLTLSNGVKIEVKGRIFEAKRIPMTYIKNSTIASMTFDYLIYIVFDESMRVKYAMKISHSNFKEIAKYVEPANAPPKWVFVAKPTLLASPHVLDITKEIQRVEIRHNACLISEQNKENYDANHEIYCNSILEAPSAPLQSGINSASFSSQKEPLTQTERNLSKFNFDGSELGKPCSICGCWYPIDEFDYGSRDNNSYCHTCCRENQSAYSLGVEAARKYRENKRATWKYTALADQGDK